jgi:hypothetical protein
MVETTLTDNINVSNVATLPVLNGTVLFTHAEPVIKLHQDMHPKHVKDAYTMMESADITISMVMMMKTSLENAELHKLFVYIYFQIIQIVEQFFYFPNSLSSLLTLTTNYSLCFFLLLLISILSLVLQPTNPICLLSLSSTTHGFLEMRTSLSIVTISYTAYTNPISTNHHYSEKSFFMEN